MRRSCKRHGFGLRARIMQRWCSTCKAIRTPRKPLDLEKLRGLL